MESVTPTATPPEAIGAAIFTGGQKAEQRRIQLVEQSEVRRLASRDREVRAHEQAHAAVGGKYAGAPRYEFERGPNGVNYAVAGSVRIDVSPVAGDPQATLDKMIVVQRAALAPAQPSSADRAIAARAAAQAAEARAELATQRAEQRGGATASTVDGARTSTDRAQADGGQAPDRRASLVVDTLGANLDLSV